MPRIGSIEELRALKERVREDVRICRGCGTRIIVGLGTCGIAAGARDTMRAVLEELERRGIEATVDAVGCIGMCYNEPLLDIQQAGRPRITYGNVSADRVPRIIEEHLVNGGVVEEWVVGRLDVGGTDA
ncbi:MAG: (2Fe-2S) ferredoxin domain-containing protein [Anaerolineae bacterium]|nr:(2Fe-2S) ferredoxin domain-containing protein [Anaerolineae bacterium]